MDMRKHEEVVVKLIKKLVSEDYHTAKGAACSIIAGVFPGETSKKWLFLNFFALACSANTQNEFVR